MNAIGAAFKEEESPAGKPTSIDDLLKQMLLDNPSLMAQLSKETTAQIKEPTQRTKKAPGLDFYLVVYSGCEMCHAITPTTYSMQWDGLAGCYRTNLFRQTSEFDAKREIKNQIVTSRTCVSCLSELGRLEKDDLVRLTMSMSDPEASIIRLVQLKKVLKGMLL